MHAKNKANPDIHAIIIPVVRTNITKAVDKHPNRAISIPVSIIHVIEPWPKPIEHRIEHATKNRSIIIPDNINNSSWYIENKFIADVVYNHEGFL